MVVAVSGRHGEPGLHRRVPLLRPVIFYTALALSSMPAPCLGAQEKLSYDQARVLLFDNSDAIHAAEYQIESERDNRLALDRLRLPTLSIDVGVLAYGSKRELNTEALQDAVSQVSSNAAQLVPSSIDLDLSGTRPTAVLTSTWSLYAGGRIAAARRLADATIDQVKVEHRQTLEHQEAVLASIYFGYLLAENVRDIRVAVLASLERHLHLALRFEDNGVLSKVERMHAQVAYDEARRNLEQARADYEISGVALRRLLRLKASIQPMTPLFVISAALPPLADFLSTGLNDHSQIALLHAKHQQAVEGTVIEKARWKPTVEVFGAYNLAPQDADFSDPLPLLQPDWLLGINVSYPLFDRHNRQRLIHAAEQRVRRVDALEREVEVGLATLIEKSYRSVERARQQFMLLQSNIELTEETLRLRERLFEEGLGTSLDVVDARLATARAETERAVAAYDFAMSLVQLLEASGHLDRFGDYIAQGDIRLATGADSR